MQSDKWRNLQDIVLGSLLRDPGGIDLVATELSPLFFTGDNRKIYGRIMTIADAGERPDIVRVSADLHGEIPADRIAQLPDLAESSGNIEYYVGELGRERRQLQAIERLKSTTADLEKGVDDSDAVLEDLVSDMTKALDGPGVADASTEAIAADLLTDIQYSAEHPGELPGTSTGIRRLDTYTKGMQPGQLWLAGAFTSVGKSALQQQIAGFQAAEGAPVAYLTLEMTGEETLLRITAQLQHINMMQLRYPCSPGQLQESRDAIGTVSRLPLHIRETVGVSIDKLAGIIRGLVRLRGVQVVYVDYVNLIPGTDRSSARYLELSEVSRTLKQIAIQLGICIVASAQLGRDAGGRAPTLRDIRESMNLAFDADIVLLLHRERQAVEYDGAGSVEILSNQAVLFVEKNRNGPCGPVKLDFHSGFLRFDEVSAS